MPPLLAPQGDERQAGGGCAGALPAGGRTCSIHPAGALAGGASPCLRGGVAGLAETMQSSLGGFQPNCPAAALEE